jgi:hypothetical protein
VIPIVLILEKLKVLILAATAMIPVLLFIPVQTRQQQTVLTRTVMEVNSALLTQIMTVTGLMAAAL